MSKWLIASLALVVGCPRTSEPSVPPDVVPDRDGGSARCPADGGALDLATLRALGLEPALSLPLKATARVTMAVNLDVRAPAPSAEFDANEPDLSASFSASILVYDSLSVQHQLTLWFVKTDATHWDWHALVPGDEWASGRSENVEGASGTLEFNVAGELTDQIANTSVFLFSGALPQEVRFDFAGSTQSAQLFVTSAAEQDGYPAGNASEVHADATGSLVASYSNGQTRPIGHCP